MLDREAAGSPHGLISRVPLVRFQPLSRIVHAFIQTLAVPDGRRGIDWDY